MQREHAMLFVGQLLDEMTSHLAGGADDEHLGHAVLLHAYQLPA